MLGAARCDRRAMTALATVSPVSDVADLGAAASPSVGRVAIVHDYLNQRGGAEKVVLEMSDMWPQAPIYTSLYRPDSTFEEFRGRDIRASFVDRIPVDRGFRNLFPLYPAAFWSFGEIDADVLVASSSGWAHMARAVQSAVHVVYCHTPARWLYRDDYMSSGGRRARRQSLMAPLRGGLRRFDANAARRADTYVVNSAAVRRRVRAAYGLDPPVVYPPVHTERLRPRPRGERLLVISRLLPYKRVDLIVAAARQLGLGLDVVGDGPLHADLRRSAGPDTTFHGAAQEETVTHLLETCSAVCVAGEEDFGIVAVEAQAAGKPVVAYGRGGARETVIDGVTGVLFEEQTVACVVEAVSACERLDTSPETIARSAARFSAKAFSDGLSRVIAATKERCALDNFERLPMSDL
jgi:glycosyltransferase involved in cell wall biosynthesis